MSRPVSRSSATHRVRISTFEIDESTRTHELVLEHIFHGKTLEEAVQRAKSHLITDFFFSSSMLESMPWKEGSVISLRNVWTLGEDVVVEVVKNKLYDIGQRYITNDVETHCRHLLQTIVPPSVSSGGNNHHRRSSSTKSSERSNREESNDRDDDDDRSHRGHSSRRRHVQLRRYDSEELE